MNKISKYFRGVNEEARRVRWPTGQELLKYVLIVLTITIIVALFLYLFDFLAIQINRAFENAFPKEDETTEEAKEATAMLIRFIGGLLR